MACPWSRTSSHWILVNSEKYTLPHSISGEISDLTILADKEHTDSVDFHVFCWKLFHTSILVILESLCDGEITPEVYLCPIADYPEQVLLACICKGTTYIVSFKTIGLEWGNHSNDSV